MEVRLQVSEDGWAARIGEAPYDQDHHGISPHLTLEELFMTKRCQSCQVVRINGMVCHESGCPDAWRDQVRECKWCGSTFAPEDRGQLFCSEECAQSYNGDDMVIPFAYDR